MKDTLTDEILSYVLETSGKSACQISKSLDADKATVYALLKRLINKNKVRRVKGEGPKGGYAYYPPKTLSNV